MKTSKLNQGNHALTLVEVLAILTITACVVLLILPSLARTKRGVMINCASNLKQIGLAFRIWEGDNGNRYPMSVYKNELGAPQFANAANASRYFLVMSNELNNPKILICQEDTKRVAATNWGADFNSSHISYFISLDADEQHSQMFLAGDSNIKTATRIKDGILEMTANQPLEWTKERHKGIGNVLMADGSVQQFKTAALQSTGPATNRLLFP
jgi:prepilin-type processing-associated H-X9-DG protein